MQTATIICVASVGAITFSTGYFFGVFVERSNQLALFLKRFATGIGFSPPPGYKRGIYLTPEEFNTMFDLAKIETVIKTITTNSSSLDPAVLAAAVHTEVTNQNAALVNELSTLQASLTADEGVEASLLQRVSDVEQALTDTVNKLAAGDTTGAAAAAGSVLPGGSSSASGSASGSSETGSTASSASGASSGNGASSGAGTATPAAKVSNK